MDGHSRSLRGRLVNHCLLVELEGRLLLVDTGYGLRDIAEPRARMSPFFLTLLKPELREEMTAVRQIEALGFDPHDVRDVLLTHLDWDHAGGLDDFPWATVHLMAVERESAFAQKTLLDRMRYRPQQWSTRDHWRTYDASGGDAWFGFESVHPIEEAGADVALVPLRGHTLGHAGIALRRGAREGWLLMAGDAYFDHRELDLRPRCTPGLRLYQTMMEKDRRARRKNQRRLRELQALHGDVVTIVCGHDTSEFERLAGRSAHAPVQPMLPPFELSPVPT